MTETDGELPPPDEAFDPADAERRVYGTVLRTRTPTVVAASETVEQTDDDPLATVYDDLTA